jgi:hypothetical protein
MTPLQIIEREMVKLGEIVIRRRIADQYIPRDGFVCWHPAYTIQVGHGDTLEEAYAMMSEKLDALTLRRAA